MYALIPFTDTTLTQQFQIKASLFAPQKNQWTAEFHLRGKLTSLRWPTASPTTQRRDHLWQSTCFEFFLAPSLNPQEAYYEVNASPQGDWNAYQLSAYRQDLRPLLSSQVEISSQHSADDQEAHIIVSLTADLLPPPRFASLTAVLQFQDGSLSYWALKHPRSEADFHDKQAFLVTL